MSIENSAKNKEDVAKSFERKKKTLSNFIETTINSDIVAVQRNGETRANSIILLEALDRLLEKLKEAIPSSEQELSDLYNVFAQLALDDKNKFVKNVSERLLAFMISNYTLEEIEQIARRSTRYKNVPINRLIEYGVTDKVLHIHVPITFVENTTELRTLFVDALKKLAENLKNNPELAAIKKITAESSLVVKAQKSLRELGFTIVAIDIKKVGLAEISKKRLIELYG
ncbi:MAG: hypothetical protein Q8P97_02110 [bacterium]|nr:hypothetical protein [bacterium]